MSRLYKRGNVYWFDFQINGPDIEKVPGKQKEEMQRMFFMPREKEQRWQNLWVFKRLRRTSWLTLQRNI